MDNLTPELNYQAIENIRREIEKKTNGYPYFATNATVLKSITDMDHHPYTRWFRGVSYYPEPIIMEREAGFRPINNNCYDINMPLVPDEKPNLCFESACSTTFPCYPEHSIKYTEKNNLNAITNNVCLVQYR